LRRPPRSSPYKLITPSQSREAAGSSGSRQEAAGSSGKSPGGKCQAVGGFSFLPCHVVWVYEYRRRRPRHSVQNSATCFQEHRFFIVRQLRVVARLREAVGSETGGSGKLREAARRLRGAAGSRQEGSARLWEAVGSLQEARCGQAVCVPPSMGSSGKSPGGKCQAVGSSGKSPGGCR